MIHLLSVSKAYRNEADEAVVVMRPTTLSIPTNRRVGILGGPGSGKSTLLGLIVGTIRPLEGEVLTAARLSPIIGGSRYLNQRLSGLENAAYFARLYGLPVDSVQEYVAIASGLEDSLSRPLREVPPPARAWLLFCIAGALGPECVIADDALAGRGRQYAEKAKQMVMDGLVGQGLIYSSRQPEAIRDLCDLVVVIRDGTLYPFDDVDEGIRFFER